MAAGITEDYKVSSPNRINSIDGSTSPRDVIVDAYTAPLFRKLKSRHLQMVSLLRLLFLLTLLSSSQK